MFWISAIIGLLLGWSLGSTSNGMTSPRTAFNIFTVPLTAIVGLVLGLFVGLVTGSIVAVTLTSLLGGAIGGFIGLAAARIRRGSW